jgi:hypothetical protein
MQPEAEKRPLADFRALVGSRWRHRKGGDYEVVQIAYRESDSSIEVVYVSRASGDAFIRPYDEFMDGRFLPLEAER